MKNAALPQPIDAAGKRGIRPGERPIHGAREAPGTLAQRGHLVEDLLAPASPAGRAVDRGHGDLDVAANRHTPPDAAPAAPRSGAFYIPVRVKFALSLAIATTWAYLSYSLARPWIADLSAIAGQPLAYLTILSIAIVPGFMNAFLAAGLLLDRRPKRKPISICPDISVLVAAYNEQDSIASTIESIAGQQYPGGLDVIVINDGSTDGTMKQLGSRCYPWLRVIDLQKKRRQGERTQCRTRRREIRPHDHPGWRLVPLPERPGQHRRPHAQ